MSVESTLQQRSSLLGDADVLAREIALGGRLIDVLGFGFGGENAIRWHGSDVLSGEFLATSWNARVVPLDLIQWLLAKKRSWCCSQTRSRVFTDASAPLHHHGPCGGRVGGCVGEVR